MRVSSALHHLLSLLISVSLLLTPAAPTVWAQEGAPVWLPFVGSGRSTASARESTAFQPKIAIQNRAC